MQENGSVPLTSADEILEFRHNLATNAHDPSDLQVISLQITFLTVFHAKGQSFSEHRFHWRHSSVDACLRFGHNSRQLTYEYHSFSPLLSSPPDSSHVHHHISALRIHLASHSPFSQTQTNISRTRPHYLPPHSTTKTSASDMNQLTYLLPFVISLLAVCIHSTDALAIDNFHCKQATCQEFHHVSDQRRVRRSFHSLQWNHLFPRA
jgi:hypothetical protein